MTLLNIGDTMIDIKSAISIVQFNIALLQARIEIVKAVPEFSNQSLHFFTQKLEIQKEILSWLVLYQ